MRATSDLGNDPAETHVFVDARSDLMCQQLGAAHNSDTGFVTRRLNAQDEGFAHASIISGGNTGSHCRFPARTLGIFGLVHIRGFLQGGGRAAVTRRRPPLPARIHGVAGDRLIK